MLNNIDLCGRLTANPELRATGNGTSVATFTLAVERDFRGPNDEKEADFINCVAWRSTAEHICRYFQKGKLMILNGRLQVRKYEAQDGTNRYATEVIVKSVYFAGDKDKTATDSNTDPFDGFTDITGESDDLPF